MTPSPSFRRFISNELRRLFVDEALLVVLLLLTALTVFVSPITDTPLKVVVGPLFLLFAPGYAFTLAVFPEDGAVILSERDGSLGLETLERIVVSVGSSIAIAGLVGLGLSHVRWGITAPSIFASVGSVVVCCLGIGGYRRRNLPPEDRFVPPIRSRSTDLLRSVRSGPAGRRTLNLLLVVAVVTSIGVVIHAAESPNDAETFTELYLFEPNGTDERVVAESVDEMAVGSPENLTVEIESREFQRTEYSLVVALQRVSNDGTSTTVTEQDVLRRFTPTIAHNETWQRTHSVTPTMSGERLRLVYLLYRGDPPDQPTLQNAYREAHLWVTVESEDDQVSSRVTDPGTAIELPNNRPGFR